MVTISARKGNIAQARAWLGKALAAGLEPTQFMHSAMIKAHLMQNDLPAAIAHLEEAVAGGLHPNNVIYTSIITAYAKQGDTAQAEKWFARAEGEGVALNI